MIIQVESVEEEPGDGGPPLVDEVGIRLREEKVRSARLIKDAHKGQKGFVLGNGPSLPLHRLHELNNHVTIGMNRTADIYDSTYYIVLDSIWFAKPTTTWYKERGRLFTIGDSRGGIQLIPGDERDLWSWDLTQGVCAWNVGLVALQLACWLGLSPIYCLGFDGTSTHFDGTTANKSSMDRIMPKVLSLALRGGAPLFSCTPPSEREESALGVLPYVSLDDALDYKVWKDSAGVSHGPNTCGCLP